MPFPEQNECKIPAALENLVEQAARDVHQAWEAQRYRNGWRYGPRYDPVKKQHPCMLPYEELSREEQEIDRTTVTQVIRSLVKSGCKITPPDTAREG